MSNPAHILGDVEVSKIDAINSADALAIGGTKAGTITIGRSGQAVTLAGTSTLTGNVTASGNIAVADGNSVTFGTDSDLTVSHSGTNATLVNTTGSVTLDNQAVAGDIVLQMGADTNAVSVKVKNNTGTDLVNVGGDGHVMLGSAPSCVSGVLAQGTGAQTLTIANLLANQIFYDDPEGAQTLTLDTAVNIVAGLPDARVGQTLGPYYIINDATNASGEAITLAVGAGGTLVKPTGVTATITEGTSHYGIFFIRLTAIGSGLEAYTAYLLTEG